MAQVKLDFNRMTEAGLGPLVKKFEKHGLNVAGIDATNRPKRESGFQVKDALFTFESGQTLLVRVKSEGTVFQVKLNKKVVPIKHVDDMDKAIIELVDYVQDNEARYVKAKNQRLKRQKVKLDKPAVRTSRKEQIEQAEAARAELNGLNEELERTAIESEAAAKAKDAELSNLTAELESLVERREDLKAELEELKTQVGEAA